MNTARRESDDAFLATPWKSVAEPLRVADGFRKILFAPGAGLGLGDQCMCVPLVRALQTRYAKAQLSVYTPFAEFWQWQGENSIRVLRDQPGGESSILDLVGHFDLTLAGYYPRQLYSLSRCGANVIFGAGERLTEYRCFLAGSGTCREIPLRQSRNVVAEARRFLALFADFGICTASEVSRWLECEAGRRNGASARRAAGPPHVLIHPTAAQPYKEWPLERWKQLASDLIGAGFLVSVSSGARPRDWAIARELARDAPGSRLLHPLGWVEFVEKLREFDLVLSGDTSVPHVVALSRATVSLAVYGPTDPIRFCPPSDACFLVSPFDLSRGEALNAVAGCISVVRGEWERIARNGKVADLRRAAAALIGALQAFGEGSKPEPSRSGIELLMREYRQRVRPEFRGVLAGDADVFRRVSLLFRNHGRTAGLEFVRQSPCYRSARWLADCEAPGK